MFLCRALSGYHCIYLLLPLLLLGSSSAAGAAEPEFVGVLSLAVEDEGAEYLGLSPEVREQLGELVQQRERAAIDLALQVKDLPHSEATARLAPFVAESERRGLALLTIEQREKLSQLRIAKSGMESLSDPEVAEVLNLSDEQKARVQALLAQRNESYARGGRNERRITRALYERQLAAVLTEEQRANWQKMAGLIAPAPPLLAQSDPPQASASTSREDAGGRRAEEAEQPSDETTPPRPPSDAKETDPPEPEAAPFASDPGADLAADAPRKAPADRESPPEKRGEEQLVFNFQHVAWEEVLQWFADRADLSLQITEPPPGVFNYRDKRSFTPREALDIMNKVLLTKGYSLVINDRTLMLLNLEDEIPPELVELVSVDELEERGNYEIVKTLFHFAKVPPETLETEIGGLLGPGRSMVVLPEARQVLVTETVGKLKLIKKIIEDIENPKRQPDKLVVQFELEHVIADEVLSVARPLLGLPEEENTNEQINISTDTFGTRIFATGQPEAIKRLEEIVPLVDKPRDEAASDSTATEQPQLASYPINAADQTQVLQVMQTLLAGTPDARLAVDPVSGKLIAFARPSDHRTILATLRELEGESERTEVIPLQSVDPQLVVLTVNKLFGLGEEGAEGPKIDGDPNSMKLFVRGTPSQVAAIRELVEKLEDEEQRLDPNRGNVRLLPLNTRQARQVVESLQGIWPQLTGNPVRLVAPSELNASIFDQRAIVPAEDDEEGQEQGRPSEPPAPAQPPGSSAPDSPERRPDPAPEPAPDPAEEPSQTFLPHQQLEESRLYVSRQDEAQEKGLDEAPAESEDGPAGAERGPAPADRPEDAANGAPGAEAPGAEIIVSITPRGLVIASSDREALDQFERQLRELLPAMAEDPLGGRDITVFYLKYSTAEIASQLLRDMLGGTDLSGGGDVGDLMGDMAAGLMGGGGILGALMGGGGGAEEGGAGAIIAAGSLTIIPDPRLNRLITLGLPEDIIVVKDLLKIIDQESSITDVQTTGAPRIIPVIYTSAEQIAEVVRGVFADRIAGGQQQQQQRQPSPQDLIRALRGGEGGGRGRGGRGGRQESRGELPKMTLAVDSRSNSLIVVAPEQLYRQVRDLVESMDQQGIETAQTVVTVPIQNVDAAVVHKALTAVLGPQATTTTGTQSGTSSDTSRSSGASRDDNSGNGPSADQIRQRIELFRQLRERGGERGSERGGQGGGDRGRPGGGFGRGSGGGPGGGFGRGGGGGDSRGGGDRGSRGRGR